MNINENSIESLLAEFGAKITPDSSKEEPIEVPIVQPLVNGRDYTPTPFDDKAPRLAHAFDPHQDIKHEKAEHRLMVLLKAAGYSNAEICKETGFTPFTVSNVMKQPWAERMILERIHGTADKAMQVLQDAAEAAAKRLVSLAENAKNDEVKRKANNDILDRKYGKPNQPYSVKQRTAEDISDAELAKLVQSNN